MPIAIFKYRLPEEEHEYRAASLGADALAVLWDIDQRLRSLCDHGEPTPETRQLAEQIRNMIPFELLEA